MFRIVVAVLITLMNAQVRQNGELVITVFNKNAEEAVSIKESSIHVPKDFKTYSISSRKIG